MNRNRTIDTYIELLTFIWLKWVDNFQKSKNFTYNISDRRKSAERCEKLQRLRYRLITKINKDFEEKLNNG